MKQRLTTWQHILVRARLSDYSNDRTYYKELAYKFEKSEYTIRNSFFIIYKKLTIAMGYPVRTFDELVAAYPQYIEKYKINLENLEKYTGTVQDIRRR